MALLTVPLNANSTNNFGVALLIVDPTPGNGTHTSITNALTVAVSGQTIFIRPGTYTESFTLPPGINLTAFECDSQTPNVIVVGTITMTAAGTSSISGIQINATGAFGVVVSGSAASNLIFVNCSFNATNHTFFNYTSSSASSSIQCKYCFANVITNGTTLFTMTSPGTLNFIYCNALYTASSTTASTCSAGILNINDCAIAIPVTTSGTAACTLINTTYTTPNLTCMTIGGSGGNNIKYTSFNSGTASAISISSTGSAGPVFVNCDVYSTNTNAITGAGAVGIGDIFFTGSSSLVNVTTQIPLVNYNNAVEVVTPGSYPYTTVPQDAVILVDSSIARTIVPLASPTTGQMHRIKDNVGSAATNNITITPSGKNIDGGASFVINNNWGSVEIVFNGTQWNLL